MRKICWCVALLILPLAGWGQQPSDTLRINLKQALEIALTDNPTIQIANQEIQRVDYSRKGAWYGLIPTLDASAQAAKYVVSGKMSMLGTIMDSPADYSVTATLSLSIPLVVPALWRSIQMTELQMQMAQEQARASKITLRNEVEKAYYQILLAQDSYKTLQESFGLAKQNYEEAKNRFDLGFAAEYDYISAEVQMNNLVPTILQIENGITQAKLYLKVLMGVEHTTPIAVEGSLMDYENQVAVGAFPDNVSLANNSDLIQLEIQQKQLHKQLQLQRTQRMPTLVGFGQYGYSGTGTKDAAFMLGGQSLPMPGREDWFSTGMIVGVQLNVPIFSGGTKWMKEKQIKVSAKSLELQRSYVEDNLNLLIRTSLNNMEKAVKQMESNKKSVALAQKGYNIAEKRYETGAGTMLELRSSSVALTQSKLAYSQAIADYLAAHADYQKVTGQ